MSDGHSDSKRYSRFYGEFSDGILPKKTEVKDIEIVLHDGAVHPIENIKIVVGEQTFEMTTLANKMRRLGWI